MFHMYTVGYQLVNYVISFEKLWAHLFQFTLGEWFGIFIGLLSIAVALIVPFIYEIWKKPNLQISLDENRILADQNTRYLHGKVINVPHSRLWWIERYAAVRTKVVLTFYDSNGRLLFGDSIEAKWVSKPRCLTLGKFDDTKVPSAHRQTILPDEEGESFDIVIKNNGNPRCYGFNETPDAMALMDGAMIIQMRKIHLMLFQKVNLQ